LAATTAVKTAPYPAPSDELQRASTIIYNLALKNIAQSTRYAAYYLRMVRGRLAAPDATTQSFGAGDAAAGPSRAGGVGGLSAGAMQVKSEAPALLPQMVPGGLPLLGQRKPNIGAIGDGMDFGMDNQVAMPGAYAWNAYSAPAAGVPAVQHGITCTCMEDPADCDKDDDEENPYAHYQYELDRPRE
jgi:hypothetical protein